MPGAERFVWWAALALLALWALGRALGLEGGYPLVALVAFTPYVLAVSTLLLGAALWARRRPEAVAAAAVVVAFAALVLPRAFPSQPTEPPADGVRLDVATVNAGLGQADAATIVDLVRDRGVDLLSVQELTPAEAGRIAAAGIDALLPHRELSPEPGSGGAGLYSRHPLRRLPEVPGGISRQVSAEVRVPGAPPVEAVAVHPHPPTRLAADLWLEGMEALPPADPDGAIRLLVGDFNSGFDQDAFRELVGSGYVDAAAARGQGLAATWPSGRAFPPPVTIDHVLADERVHVAGAAVLDVPGSDHRAVAARLVLPRDDRG